MSYYAKDLNAPCACAVSHDAEWFMVHPGRKQFIREPWSCEYTELAPEHVDVVSQVVVVWMERSVDEFVADTTKGLVTCHIYRRSFLYMGDADWHRIDSDDGVSRFMDLINDDATGEIDKRRMN